jgi:hypothetical protein
VDQAHEGSAHDTENAGRDDAEVDVLLEHPDPSAPERDELREERGHDAHRGLCVRLWASHTRRTIPCAKTTLYDSR